MCDGSTTGENACRFLPNYALLVNSVLVVCIPIYIVVNITKNFFKCGVFNQMVKYVMGSNSKMYVVVVKSKICFSTFWTEVARPRKEHSPVTCSFCKQLYYVVVFVHYFLQ